MPTQPRYSRRYRCQHVAWLVTLLLLAAPVLAHHSYADYDRAERFELRGIITAITWANPHIIFMVHSTDGDMRIEWITVTGADKTSASKDQFGVGNELIVIGSRNLDPDRHIMTLVKELHMPQSHFDWEYPAPAGRKQLAPGL